MAVAITGTMYTGGWGCASGLEAAKRQSGRGEQRWRQGVRGAEGGVVVRVQGDLRSPCNPLLEKKGSGDRGGRRAQGAERQKREGAPRARLQRAEVGGDVQLGWLAALAYPRLSTSTPM
ncbi:MAG: hypothetical protein KF768_10450, partial [Phycisphaeraceae bacterium]|nr:hypothetical protein [Phycisphaeraceae bacterium]